MRLRTASRDLPADAAMEPCGSSSTTERYVQSAASGSRRAPIARSWRARMRSVSDGPCGAEKRGGGLT